MHLRTNSRTLGRAIDCEALKASGFKNASILVVSLDDHHLSWVDQEEQNKRES